MNRTRRSTCGIVATIMVGLTCLAVPAVAFGGTLQRLDCQIDPWVTTLTITLSEPVRHSIEVSGQLIEIYLADTEITAPNPLLTENADLVRAVTDDRGDGVALSLLLRSPPKEVRSRDLSSTRGLIAIDIIWGADKTTRPAMTGLPAGTIEKTSSATMRLRGEALMAQPPPPGELIASYHTPWIVPCPLTPSAPGTAFLPGDLVDGLHPDARGFYRRADWQGLLDWCIARFHSRGGDRTGTTLAVLTAWAVCQLGEKAPAEELLATGYEPEHDDPLRGHWTFLKAFCMALAQQPHLAAVYLTERMPPSDPGQPLFAYVELLRAECRLLADDEAGALPVLLNLRQTRPDFRPLHLAWRIADARCRQAPKRAYQDYLAIRQDQPAPWPDPYSWERFARLAIANGHFILAQTLYADLARQVETVSQRELAEFGRLYCTFRISQGQRGGEALAKLAETAGNPEVRVRARLLVLDRTLSDLSGPKAVDAIRGYRELAAATDNFALRHEAGLKMAAGYLLHEQPTRAVLQLEALLKGSIGNSLTRIARSYLHSLLPKVIVAQFSSGHPLAGLSLLERHRALLVPDQFTADQLNAIAAAYEEFGLTDKAIRVWVYVTGTEVRQARSAALFRLAEHALRAGQAELALAYTREQQRIDPASPHAGSVLKLAFEAIAIRDEQPLAEVIAGHQLPDAPDILFWAAEVLWQAGRDDAVIGRLNRHRTLAPLPPKGIMMLAEANLRQQQDATAEGLFDLLHDDPDFKDLARYRLAMIGLARGDTEGACAILSRLATFSDNSNWRQLAKIALQAARTSG